MDLKFIWLLVVLLICSSSSYGYAGMSISRDEDLELERQLKTLNKPPVKTIQTNEGDIIDCVNIYKQPAFDHPLLKNHKLQLKPTSFPVGLPKISSKNKSITMRSMTRREACPSGTVPIRRTLKEDLIRTQTLSESPLLPMGENIINPGAHVVSVRMKALGFPYYGASGYVSIYNVSLADDQASSTNLWIQGGPPDEVNLISAGWKVSPQLNGDHLTRLFTYWTGDGYKTGCYNTLCPGFVMTEKSVTSNDLIVPSSTPGGDQYDIKFQIFQDRKSGNWWLMVGEDDNAAIGYWPKELFSHLSNNGAEKVAWGGIANAGENGISPPMGSGIKPIGQYTPYKATCHFRQVRYVDDRSLAISPERDAAEYYVDTCYGLRDDKDRGFDFWRYSFIFGGPGGCQG